MAIFSADYAIHTYEADSRGAAQPTALFRFLLDAASAHADSLGFGYQDMRERRYAWMLSRFLLRVDRYPRWRETLTVRTWPSGTERLFALRDFDVRDGEGAEIARATSSWIAIDTERRAPERIERLELDPAHFVERRVFDRSADRVPALSVAELRLAAFARYGDIDLNRHVTSARYLQWCIDCLPPETSGLRELREFEANFLAEGREGDSLSVEASAEKPLDRDGAERYLHRVVRTEDGAELLRARTIWERSG